MIIVSFRFSTEAANNLWLSSPDNHPRGSVTDVMLSPTLTNETEKAKVSLRRVF